MDSLDLQKLSILLHVVVTGKEIKSIKPGEIFQFTGEYCDYNHYCMMIGVVRSFHGNPWVWEIVRDDGEIISYFDSAIRLPASFQSILRETIPAFRDNLHLIAKLKADGVNTRPQEPGDPNRDDGGIS
jgi:hypothetical protein